MHIGPTVFVFVYFFAIATDVLKNECNGENSCTYTISSEYFGGDPCFGTSKYTDIDYMCLWLVSHKYS